MKMYIVVKEDVPSKLVPVICAHASLSAYLYNQDNADVKRWLDSSFKKVVCSANNEEFQKCRETKDSVVITESSLGGREVACVLLPRDEFPGFVRFLSLWKPIDEVERFVKKWEPTGLLDGLHGNNEASGSFALLLQSQPTQLINENDECSKD